MTDGVAGQAAEIPAYLRGHGDYCLYRGIPDALSHQAAQLYWQAFGVKLGRVMGPAPLAHDYLVRVMRREDAICALDAEGQLLAIGGYKTEAGSFAGGTLADLRAVYGRAGAAWRQMLLNRVAEAGSGLGDEHSFLIDGICVRADWRGRGVGAALTRALVEEGRRRGYPAVRLEVIEDNHIARRLYERLGFEMAGSHHIGALRHVFRFTVAIEMILPLPVTISK
jgi:ribosomal protein S18 acetylase RimI-like enzyme